QEPVGAGGGARSTDIAVVVGLPAVVRTDLAVLEHGGGTSVEEVDVSFDEGVVQVHPGGLPLGRGLGQECVLIAKQPPPAQREPVPGGAQRLRLATSLSGLVIAVLDGDVSDRHIVRQDREGGGAGAAELPAVELLGACGEV